jgi:NAD(P)-dependent dehydrogenase (short-subunit alcohol dehydrogenase family)
MRPEGRAALVTGGAVRIGRAISLRLAESGHAVAIHANQSRDAAKALADTIRQNGGRAAVVIADLSSPEQVDRLIDDAVKAIGPLTLLVNNASMFEHDGIGTLTREQWNRQFRVNLQTPSFLAQDFAAQAPDGSSIINIIDQRVWKPTPHFYSYTLTKSALLTATRTMAQALAPRIRVNAVGPGPTLTNVRQGDDDFARQSEAVLLRRGPTPEEIADAVLYLAEAKSVTGQMIAVDGGQHLAWETPDVVGIRE